MKTATQSIIPQQIDPPRQSVIYSKEHILNEEQSCIYDLKKEEELRIEVERNEKVSVLVEQGLVEIEGQELPLNFVMTFTYTKFSIFCWTDARIKVEGSPTSIYQSDSNKNTMNQYLMVHNIINESRNEALLNNEIGPRILVTGSKSSGKSALCHSLLNWALKLGWTPIWVDLDPSNSISVPGTISASVVDFNIPNDFLIDNSICLYSGNLLNDLNIFLYEIQISELASIVNSKLEYDLQNFKKKYNLNNPIMLQSQMNKAQSCVSSESPTIYASGLVIHCPNIPTKDLSIYQKIVKDFKLDMIYVIENEKLYNSIKPYLEQNTSINLLQKTKGINEDPLYKEHFEQKRFESYFKGAFNNLKISELKIDLNQFKVLQIISSNVTSSLLPIGFTSELNLIIREVSVEESLLNRVIAVVQLDERVIHDLDNNFDKKLSQYVDVFARATVSFFAYM